MQAAEVAVPFHQGEPVLGLDGLAQKYRLLSHRPLFEGLICP
jgi:hypothetical protein